MSSTTDHRSRKEIDLNKVPPLDHHRTAVSFNCLILKMTEILNNFGNRMEHVLERAEHSLDIADRKLKLMEAKLSTVNLDKDDSSKSIQPVATTSNNPSTRAEPDPEPQPSSSVTSDVAAAVVINTPEPAGPTNSAPVVLIKDDTRYSKYFKMLKMGVPEAGVIQKMESEGIDSSLLKRGDEPSVQVPNNSGYESSGESVSSFSDSD